MKMHDGSVVCTIKRGVLPSMKPTRSKRLWQIVGNGNVDTVGDSSASSSTTNYFS